MRADILAAKRVAGFGDSVFSRYTRLAKELDAINLGQGYPDFEPPEFVLQAFREAVSGDHQYAPVAGMPELLEAVAAEFRASTGIAVDPASNVQVTVGATEALFAATQALLDPGDEVIIFEPFYDAYPADVIMAGGVPRFVPLEPQGDGSWLMDPARLETAFTERTKMVIVNTPHNPAGKVFSAAELDLIVALAERFDALILSDEVYEHIAWRPHVSVAARPGAWERTLTVSSVGKTFSVTGWKIGWLVGPERLIKPVRAAHQWLSFAVATPLQRASAEMIRLARGNGYYIELAGDYGRKRDLLHDLLSVSPLRPRMPDGSYFLLADATELGFTDARELCLKLPEVAGVAAIPVSEFYSAEQRGLASQLVRFAFCKSEVALREAGGRLQRLLANGVTR